ncbi:MAG: TetR/AcrR family transcriptional regulator [Geminicoccales bacterium]
MPRPNVEPQRRRQILAAATRVFAQGGLATARMEDVAAAAGISKGAIYLYFPSKEALVLAIVDELYAGDAARMRAEASGDSAEQRLRSIAHGLAKASTEGRALLPLVLDVYSLGARDPTVRARLDAYFDAYRDEIRDILVAGEASGEMRCPAGPEAAALAIVAAFEGAFWLWALESATTDLARAFDDVLTTFVRGIAR